VKHHCISGTYPKAVLVSSYYNLGMCFGSLE
jgi:hypothetical protein